MKKLPIGIQDFEKLRTGGFMYIDKTEKIFDLVDGAGYYFLSRPRRFGKSLLVSTLKEIFSGKRELFDDLWIEDKIEWKKFPVLHFSFTEIDYKKLGLEKAIEENLFYHASLFEITLEAKTITTQLQELVRKLHKKFNERVVILIDEYDKPIIDFLGKDEIHIAEENRDIMKNFYSPIKSLDPHLRFFFLTGVSRFSKVSIFSDLNNLNDISLEHYASDLLGYTEKEILHYFSDYITLIAKNKNISEKELTDEMREWYNGYNFRGIHKVYNPFSVLSFFKSQEFNNYWFKTGTPTFLIKLLAENEYYDIEEIETSLNALEKFEITNLNPVTILFQTGYFTIKDHLMADIYLLGYPNREVQNSMNQLLLAEYAKKETTETTSLLYQIKKSFDKNQLDKVFVYINALFADIPYQIFEDKKESYYHSIVHLIFSLLGYYTQSEVSTSEGRIDAVVETEKYIYILEFKVDNTAQNAIKQIKEKNYSEKYKSEKENGKTIYIIGVACNEKTIKEYLVEQI
ncbi:AAA family ATPase [Bernardetia sp. ABR2-2B]|uniref:ATP-binding protein n=1 Tax=Bernardetia sp. ABR2-2B TaxID=3127472 RepID=UPI0030CBC3A7